MPSIQQRPVDVSNIISGLQARILKLESYPPSGMTLLAQTIVPYPTNTVHGFTAYPAFVTMSETPCSFTLIRPVPILLVANFNYFTSGGTASYAIVRAIISNSIAAGATPLPDVNGNPMQSDYSLQNNGAGRGVLSAVSPFICPAGTYVAEVQYCMDAGATTTLTDSNATVSVYQLSG